MKLTTPIAAAAIVSAIQDALEQLLDGTSPQSVAEVCDLMASAALTGLSRTLPDTDPQELIAEVEGALLALSQTSKTPPALAEALRGVDPQIRREFDLVRARLWDLATHPAPSTLQ